MKTRSERSSLRKILGESAIIIFSVLLALFANEWRSGVNEQRETDLILSHILSELRENKEVALVAYAYHKSVFDTLQNLDIETAKDSLFNGFYFDDFKLLPKGVMQQGFNDIAWTVAKEERLATRINFERSQVLYNAYRQQQTVDHTLDRITDLTFDRRTHDADATVKNLVMLNLLFYELTAQEEELLFRYRQAIDDLD